jgi:hypothetical protein
MDFFFNQVRTQEEYNRLLRGDPPPKPTPADKERDFQHILSEFRQVIVHYKKANEHWWYGSLLNMKQQFLIGDMQRETAALKDNQVDIAMTCSLAPKTITVTHGFRSTRLIPIPNASYRVVKRPVITPMHHPSGRYINFPRYGYTLNDKPVTEGKFDSQGKANVELPACEAGHQYHLLINTDITPQDREALFGAYQGVIDKYATWLTTKWNTQQRAAWATYIKDGINLTEAASAFLDGMVSQLKLLYDTVKEVWKWVSNANEYATKLGEFIGNDGVKKLQTMTDEAVGKALTLLSDEILVFILADALYCYFQLLTPQQIVNFIADAFGSLVIMIVLYLVLPPGMGQMVLSGVDNLSMAVPG